MRGSGNSVLVVISLTDIPPSLIAIALPINMPRPSPKTTHPISITTLKIWLYNSGHYEDTLFWCATYKYSGVRLTILQLYVPEFFWIHPKILTVCPRSSVQCIPQVCWCMPQSPYSVVPEVLRVFLGNRLVYVTEVFLCMAQKSGVCPRSLLKCGPEALNLCKSILCCNWEALPLYSICTFVCRNGFM